MSYNLCPKKNGMNSVFNVSEHALFMKLSERRFFTQPDVKPLLVAV
jgi:hypothetical protein